MKLKKRVTKRRKIAGLSFLKEWRRVPKKRVTLNLDADVLAWFRGMGRGYQWEINWRLRRVMEEEAKGQEG